MTHILFGLAALVLGIWGVIAWWPELGLVMRGLVPFLLVIAGFIAIGSALTKGTLENTDVSEDGENTQGIPE